MAVMLFVSAGSTCAQASFETIDGLRYLLDSEAKTATVVASSGEKYSGDVVVPEKVKAQDGVEYQVTTLGDNAFKECDNLTSVNIPNSVTTLGNACFMCCSSLEAIDIPSSVTSLGNECFCACKILNNIVIPSSVTALGNDCFSSCSRLTNVEIPSSVTTLGGGCFFNCYSLESIVIPSSVVSMGLQCFYACHGLQNVTLSSALASWGEQCFQYCDKLTHVNVPSSVSYIPYMCFADCSSLENVEIPSSIKRLQLNCFNNCSKLEVITFKGNCPDDALWCGLLGTCIFNVPKAYLQDYKDALGSKYPYIYASKDDGEDKPLEQCTTPAITFASGKLHFDSSTPNAEYHYTITDSDMAAEAYNQDGTVELSAKYDISVYATADGYKPSEKATATLYWLNANLEDGTTDINQAKTRGIVATSHDGFIVLSGLNDNEEVRFYSADGKQLGAVKAIDGVASQAIPAASASLVIAKIGGRAIKIAVK